jgi:hypothetical protein
MRDFWGFKDFCIPRLGIENPREQKCLLGIFFFSKQGCQKNSNLIFWIKLINAFFSELVLIL